MRLAIAILSILSNSLWASLEFESKVQKLDVEADSTVVEVLFSFENRTNERVIITEYDAPCTCMSAVIKGGRALKSGAIGFKPGDKGVIKGKFELGNLKGSVTKKILLKTKTESGKVEAISLDSTFNIPFLVAAFPNALSWRVDESAEVKEIKVLVDGDDPIEIAKVSSSSDQIDYTFETVKPGFEYLLKVKPKTTKTFLFAAIRMTTNSKNPRYKSLSTFITVKPQKQLAN